MKELNAQTYYALREDVLTVPDARRAVLAAADNLPQDINLECPDTVARYFVDKPLYSNMRAELGGLGDRYNHMWRHGMFPTRSSFADPEWAISKHRNGRKTDYTATGKQAKAFRALAGGELTGWTGTQPVPRPQVALYRLYHMRQIAMALPGALPDIRKAKDGFLNSVEPQEFLGHANAVREQLQMGLTTVLHAMTDLGFECVKPDIHVTRVLAYYGRLRTRRHGWSADINLRAFSAPRRYLASDWHKCHAVREVVALAKSIDPAKLMPEFRGNACREVDIVLMQASLHGLIPPPATAQ